jgi:hypothetical protein
VSFAALGARGSPDDGFGQVKYTRFHETLRFCQKMERILLIYAKSSLSYEHPST